MGMLNDGTKSYDNNKDGAGQEAGRCSVRIYIFTYVESDTRILTFYLLPSD